jgi:hypothetical protein
MRFRSLSMLVAVAGLIAAVGGFGFLNPPL